MRRALVLSLLAIITSPAGTNHAAAMQVGALTVDCRLVGDSVSSDGYQFVSTCAGRAKSPDGRLAIVQHAYRDRQPPVELQDVRGRVLARLSRISDDMPFTVFWSPDSRWIAVNHHVGSFMDELFLFEVVGGHLIERPALSSAAKRIATERFRCLSRDAVLPNVVRWAKDGHRLVMVTISSLYACSDDARPGDWWPLWMIGDVRTGRVDAASVREDRADGALHEPVDEVYKLL